MEGGAADSEPEKWGKERLLDDVLGGMEVVTQSMVLVSESMAFDVLKIQACDAYDDVKLQPGQGAAEGKKI